MCWTLLVMLWTWPPDRDIGKAKWKAVQQGTRDTLTWIYKPDSLWLRAGKRDSCEIALGCTRVPHTYTIWFTVFDTTGWSIGKEGNESNPSNKPVVTVLH